MKCDVKLLLAFYLVTFCTIYVESHGPWKNYPYYPMPVYPFAPGYSLFGQQNTKQTNVCIECINRWANFAKMFNIPDFTQFGNQFGNNGNNRATMPPPVRITATAFTETHQTTRPPLPRRSTIRPVIVQPDPNSSVRIGLEESSGFVSTEDRIKAILKTTNAPVTQQAYFTYPEIKNALNHMDYQLADIGGPSFDGLQLFYPYGR